MIAVAGPSPRPSARRTLLAAVLFVGAPGGVRAAGWDFTGPLGHFDAPRLGEGAHAFVARCAACHALDGLAPEALDRFGLDPAIATGPAAAAGAGTDAISLGQATPPTRAAADRLLARLAAGHAGAAPVTGPTARALVAFVVWCGDPHLAARHRLGVRCLVFLGIMAALIVAARRSRRTSRARDGTA